MVKNGRVADSGFLATPAFEVKLKQPLMDTNRHGALVMSGGRRVKIAGTTTTTPNAATYAAVAVTATNDDGSYFAIPTTLPTTHQKVRRILDEHADRRDRGQRPSRSTSRSSSPCSVVGNYSIVASRGELARNSFAVCETPAPTAKKKAPIVNGKVQQHRDENSRSRRQQRQPSPGRQQKKVRSIGKSASVPADPKEGLNAREKRQQSPNGRAVLLDDAVPRRSSFGDCLFPKFGRNGYPRERLEGQGNSLSRRSSSILAEVDCAGGDRVVLKRSPSCQTLPTSLKKSSVGVKKSVSFSSDTSFEEKRSSCRKTAAVHEAKVYRKGVLQDRGQCADVSRKVPPTSEVPSGGPKALLRAAREADETVLREVLARIRNFGFDGMDVNAVDGSGRTAISYMVGNGSIAMVEVALSFPGLDANLPDNEGNTPLHFAAQAGQAECLNALLQRCPGIELDARNILGFTPLMKAALQGRTKCAKMLLFAGANPTLRDYGRGLRAEQWARFCGRYVCAEVIERFARHRLLERTTSCRWGSEPELAAKVLQGKVIPVPTNVPPPSTGLRSKIRRVFRTTSGPERSFSLVSQLTSAALCASSPALPKPGDVPPVVKSLLRPLSVPQLRVTLVAPPEIIERPGDKYGTNFTEKIESAIVKPPRVKKKNK